MGSKAVIFDLYGTLVDEFPKAAFTEALVAMADILDAPTDAFNAEWTGTAIERQTGRMGDIEENLRLICGRLDLHPSPEDTAKALQVRGDMYRDLWNPKQHAETTLASLKADGFPVALISMCAPDTPAMWRASALAQHVDVEVFSSETGLRKPRPEIYQYATERLHVDPSVCLYVGDGAYGELTGAAALGMTAVLIHDPEETPGSMLRPDAEHWRGTRITSLAEVLDLV